MSHPWHMTNGRDRREYEPTARSRQSSGRFITKAGAEELFKQIGIAFMCCRIHSPRRIRQADAFTREEIKAPAGLLNLQQNMRESLEAEKQASEELNRRVYEEDHNGYVQSPGAGKPCQKLWEYPERTKRGTVMGGKMLDYEAKRIPRNEG